MAAPPAGQVAERLGIPVLQPERPTAGLELGAPTVVVCAYGLLVPPELLAERAWLNVHPSLLPRWRGAAPVERAIMAGDPETGVTIHETVAALDAGPIAAQESFPIGADDDAGAVYATAAEVAARLLDRVLADPTPRFEPQEGEPTYAEKIAAGGPLARPRTAGRRARPRRPGAQPAHRRACGARRAQRDRLAGARRRGRRLRAGRGAARGRSPHVVRTPGAAGSGDERRLAGPPRRLHRAAARVRGRGVRGPGAPLRVRRGSTSATGRSPGSSPTARSSARERSTTRSRRSGGGRCGSSIPRCARRSGSAPTSSRSWTACRATRRSTSRSSSCAARGSSGPFRSRTPSSGVSRTARGRSARPSPRRPRRRPRCGTRTPTGSPRRWWRELGPDEARALMTAAERGARDRRAARARLGRGPRGRGDPGRLGRRPRRRAGARRGPHLAAEPRLPARRPRGRLAARRAHARPVRGARGQGDDARGRGRRGRGRRGAGRTARGDGAPAGSDRRSGRRRRRPRSSPGARGLRPGARGRAVLGSGGARLAPRPPLAGRAAPRAPARASPGGDRARAARRDGRLLDLHDQPRGVRGRRRRRRRRRRGRRSTPRSATSGRRFATARARPSSRRCLTSTGRAASSSPG